MEEIALSPLRLRTDGVLSRDPPRPLSLRPEAYEREFDYLTVFYDSFRSGDGKFIVFVGPSLLNLAQPVLPGLVRAFEVGRAADAVIRRFPLVDQLWLRTSQESAVMPQGVFQETSLRVQPNLSHLYCDKKVLLTKSRDNELVWIKDWVYFHAAHHGTNSVLLYDNASTKCTSAEIQRAIASIRGIETALVIDWPFKFGPQGDTGQGDSEVWDSDFSQRAILEHARYRFLASAHSVICGDVDELVVTQTGVSLHELAARSLESSRANTKWTAVPKRCPPHAQWRVHKIAGMTPDSVLSESAAIRHFKAINTNWRVPRFQPETPIEGKHVVDEELVHAFRVFA
ncbi:MAG: hypothetical protein DME32_14190 [Verrucomicrobia bacterium]|nr:MAG: hypothetical protein DME32_14190 [Verrucomicrobiota bacterium]